MADFIMDKPRSEFEERVVSVDRISHTVAGGRRMRFRALVVVGNRSGRVGMGVAKAGEVQAAVQKAVTQAKKHLIQVPIVRDTIPHAVVVNFGSARVLLKPAPAGTSVIAGGSVRAVIELAGIKNILSKSLGSNNKINNVTATLEALGRLQLPKVRVAPAPAATIAEPEPATEPATVKKPTTKAKKAATKKRTTRKETQ